MSEAICCSLGDKNLLQTGAWGSSHPNLHPRRDLDLGSEVALGADGQSKGLGGTSGAQGSTERLCMSLGVPTTVGAGQSVKGGSSGAGRRCRVQMGGLGLLVWLFRSEPHLGLSFSTIRRG